MKNFLAFLSISLISGSLITIDLANLGEKVELRSSKTPGYVLVKQWKNPLPPCAFGPRVKIIGKPTLFANFLEILDGNQRLIASARENALAESQLNVNGLEPVMVLAAFREDGYGVEFEFAQPRPTFRNYQAADRDCNAECLRKSPERQTLPSCEALERTLNQKIQAVTAVDSPRKYWYSYEFAEDFKNLTLDFTSRFCVAPGGAP